ncbi:6-phosphogluconolactonase [Limisphaera ngatamarikiensis]|uniref:6-phosphogluconolactonase n=1 Tax=Limisphaera ngatamarikiensis TaxID=1324935 RepID=A0A6M1RHU2_9BACT|nr:6-phosphogluconolactonase [Limisphaera ngatamarikiensis]NGO39618.1 6-phosphogluconolactonase [Limisphaera ngatamarikiensis]
MNLPPESCHPGPEALARAAARDLAACLRQLTAGSTHVTIALSGGRIALPFFHALTRELKHEPIRLNKVHWFLADERLVPPDNPESNYGCARKHLLDPLNIPPTQHHPIPPLANPEQAARIADENLRRCTAAFKDNVPVLDLVLLGMGEDGHIASLFPNHPIQPPFPDAAYAPVHNAPKPPATRVTLTWQALTAAQRVWVLISGPNKQQALSRSLQQDPEVPLGRLLLLRNDIRLYVDHTSLQTRAG